MTISETAITDLANKFMAAEEQRAPLEPISGLVPDLTAEDAYRVQRAIVSAKVERGERVIGRKVGATSQAIQQMLGIDEPVYGCLLESGRIPSGGMISLAGLIHPRIECEIAFLLGEDVVGPGVGVAQVLAATRAVIASLEINDPRTREWKIGRIEVIADNGLAARFVLGEKQAAVEGLDLPNVAAVLRKNGEQMAASTGAAVLGDPARAVAWLANKLSEHQQRLTAGEIVLTGSLTPICPVAPGDRFEAEFDRLGGVCVSFA